MFFFCSVGYNSQSTYHRRLVMTRSGRKIKGRGPRVGAQRLNRPMFFSSFNRLLIAFADWAFVLNIEFMVLIIRVSSLSNIQHRDTEPLLARGPEIVSAAVKLLHTGVKRCSVRGWEQSLENAGSKETSKMPHEFIHDRPKLVLQ